MAVYDAFMFFNEFDLLSVRLQEHDPFVDYFILVQFRPIGLMRESKENPYFPFKIPALLSTPIK